MPDASYPVPLMVRSFGRCGTTLLMQLLGTSPNVVFDRTYPFETRLLAYVVRLASIAGRPAHNDADWNQEQLLRRELSRIGPIPFPETAVVDRQDLSRRLGAACVRTLLRSLDTSAADPELPVYYAEKVPLDIPAFIHETEPQAKSILLLRDPRDEFLSIRAFNKKRGTLGFGWRADDTDSSFALRMAGARRPFLEHFASVHTDERRLKLRYEDLIARGSRTVEELASWLGVALSLERVLGAAEEFSHHMTAPLPDASVERWRTEMEPELRELFASRLGDALGNVGYDVST